MTSPRPIQSRHVQLQFNRRAPLDAAQFLYGEIAQRMLSRLNYMTLQPQDILDAGCGAGHTIDPLRAKYVDMSYVGLDHSAALLAVAQERHGQTPSLWQRLRKKGPNAPLFVQADLAKTDLSPASFDLIWSNLALHWHPNPEQVINEWRRLLRPERLLMFSTFGPATFQELRHALAQAQLDTATLDFVDMHDYGDMLLQHGFSDPVMDQELITLTYESAPKLIEDLYLLGGNANPQRRILGRAQLQKLEQALESQRHMDGRIHLTVEVAYGHAWRTTTQQHGNEIHIPLSSIKRKN